MTSYPDIIKLNIRGTLFHVSKSTLIKRANWFKTQIETGKELPKDDSGAIFLIRSPKHFDLILNYMNDGFVQLPDSEQEIREIKTEAGVWELTGLVESCDEKLKICDDTIKLNVGGTVFQTFKSTLTKYDGFFYKMLQKPLEKDASGAIFIDRNPKHFQRILNFMRDGYVAAPRSDVEIQELANEAKFYQFETMRNIGSTLAGVYRTLKFDHCPLELMKTNYYIQPVVIIYYDFENWDNIFGNIDVEAYVNSREKQEFYFEEKGKAKIADGHWAFSFHHSRCKDWEQPQVLPVSGFIQKLEENRLAFVKKLYY